MTNPLAPRLGHLPARAKRCIFLYMEGGPSHIDTFDPKPELDKLNGEHGWFDKRGIYEESLHMPLIVRWPDVVKPGTQIDQLVQNIDYAPTLAEIANVPVPATLHGRSLVTLLRGEDPTDWRKSIYYHYYSSGHGVPPHYGLRTDRHTLALFPRHQERELYDLQRDPQQLRNIAEDADRATLLAELKEKLARLRNQYGDIDDADAPPNEQQAKKNRRKKQ